MKRYALPVLGTALLALYLLRTDLGALGAQVVNFPVPTAAAVIALNAACGLVKTIRWRGFLRRRGTETEFPRAFLAVHAAFFMGLVTPGTAGEFSRAASLTRDRERGVAVLLLEKLTDLGSLGILTGLTVASYLASPAAFAGIVALVAVACGAAYLTYSRLRNLASRPLRAAVLRLASEEGVQSAGRVYQEFNLLADSAAAVLLSSLASAALWLLSLGQVALIYQGLGLRPPVRFVALTYFLPYLVGIVSLVPLGLGAFELSLREIGKRSADGIPGDVVGMVPAFFRAFVTLPLVGFGYGCQMLLSILDRRRRR